MTAKASREEPSLPYSAEKTPAIFRVAWTLVRFVLSPLVLFFDTFRTKKRVANRWVIYNFTLCCLVMVITGLSIIFAEEPTRKALVMLSEFDSNRRKLGEILTNKEIVDSINYYALKYNIDPFLIHALIKEESNYKPGEESHKGAKGLMQLLPRVWREYAGDGACDGEHAYNEECGYPHCIFNPKDNIRCGVNYLADLIKKFNGRVELALQAYNAGQSNVSLFEEEPRFMETRNYIPKISSFWSEQRMEAFLRFQLHTAKALKESELLLLGITGLLWFIYGLWMWRKGFIY